LARGQVAEAKRRWALWGLKGGSEVEAWEGDFCELREVAQVLPKADVVVRLRFLLVFAFLDPRLELWALN